MRILRSRKDIDAFLNALSIRAGGASPEVLRLTMKILKDVRDNGDKALLKYTQRFDGHSNISIPKSEIKRYAEKADRRVLSAIRHSARRIFRFHKMQKESSWFIRERGSNLGQIVSPIERAGIYVPGGKASYPSTVLMNVIPAQVAGVKQIAVCVPTPQGEINPNVMAALDMLGIDEVYAMGGAQAVAAFAYGTSTIKKTDKITGPGNIYVATAKKLVFGTVGIDMIAGPSEILIIADSSADPAHIASDMLSQAEHDELASSILITDSNVLAQSVSNEVEMRLIALKRMKIASASIKRYGAVIIVKSLKEAVEISNLIAPEHLEIMTKTPKKILGGITNAGAVFLGMWSPEPLGDYSAGPNHTLPTGATARFSSPLGVYDFMKRTSYIEFSREGFLGLSKPVITIAESEGLTAHADSVKSRLKL